MTDEKAAADGGGRGNKHIRGTCERTGGPTAPHVPHSHSPILPGAGQPPVRQPRQREHPVVAAAAVYSSTITASTPRVSMAVVTQPASPTNPASRGGSS